MSTDAELVAAGDPIAVIGVAFLKSWYSVFNYNTTYGAPSVGFAASA